MGWSKKLKRGVKAVATGGLSEIPYATGQVGAERDAKNALKGLGNTTNQMVSMSNAAYDEQSGVLNDTFGDQRGQIEAALSGANIADQQALAEYMQAQRGNIDNVSGMLDPQAALQGQFIGSVADASTLDGYGNMLNDVRNSDTYNSLFNERMGAASNAFADAGLRRAENYGERAADIAQDTTLELGNQAYNRQLNMLGMGNQGVLNQANYLGSANTNLNNMNMAQQNMMNQRGYGNNLAIADLMGNRGANLIDLQGQRTANNMNAIGQLGQAQAAQRIAQGQNNMAANSALLGAGVGLFGDALSGGLFGSIKGKG